MMFTCMISSLFLIIFLSSNVEMTSVVKIDTSKIIAQVDERYLSVALGMINKNWKQLDLNNQRVINMAKALTPAFVRLGGTGADLATFNDSETQDSNEINKFRNPKDSLSKHKAREVNGCEDLNLKLQKVRKNFTITKDDWMDLNVFAQKVNWTLLFDVNVILKRSDGCWDSSNYQKLLEFSSNLRYGPIAWELGIFYKLHRFYSYKYFIDL